MRRFLKILASFFILLLLLALAAPFLISPEWVKSKVLAEIRDKTGREVSVEQASFSVLPVLGLKAQGVKIGNPVWVGGGNIAEIKTLTFGLELFPLFHKEFRLRELTLDEPVITLVRRQGGSNWDFGSKAAPATPAAGEEKTPTAGAGTAQPLPALHLNKIAITNGSVTYKDAASSKDETVSGINITLKAPDLNEKADIELAAQYAGKEAKFSLGLTSPVAFASGSGPADVKLKASYGTLECTWEGTATLAIGGIPSVTGTLTIPTLDVTQLKQSGSSSSAPTPGTPAPEHAANSHWSDDPIALDGLTHANADLAVVIGHLVLAKTTLDDIHAHLHLDTGILKADVDPIKAYGGTLQANIYASSKNVVGFALNAASVDGEKLLHDFASFDRLSGQLDVEAKLAGAGASERAIVSSLSGSGNMRLKNGKLKGANLVSMLHKVAGGGAGENDSTDFSAMSMSFDAKDGILTTNDLLMSSPTISVTGAGKADLPDWSEHFLLKPMLIASAQDKSGITVPVHVDGPLDHPHYQPDFAAVLQDSLKDPSKFKQNLKSIRNNLSNGLQNLLR